MALCGEPELDDLNVTCQYVIFNIFTCIMIKSDKQRGDICYFLSDRTCYEMMCENITLLFFLKQKTLSRQDILVEKGNPEHDGA